MSDRIKVGDKVRLKKTGEVFTVEDINPNPNYVADEEAYAELWNNYGNQSADSPDDIEKIDWDAPSPETIADALSLALNSRKGDLEVHETSHEGDGLVAVLGRWKGMQGGFYVRFGAWQEDML